MTPAIARTDLTATALRGEARRSRDAKEARRCLATTLALEGCSRTGTAESAGTESPTLRDRVHRCNADGVAGLRDRAPPARAGLSSPDPSAAFDRIVEAGPDLAVDGVVRGRRADRKCVIERRFAAVTAERTAGGLLPARLQPRVGAAAPSAPREAVQGASFERPGLSRPAMLRSGPARC